MFLGTISFASNLNEAVIISPSELEGVTGTRVNLDDVYVQKVNIQRVENIKNIEIVNDSGQPITHFLNKSMKARVRDKKTKANLGFITLKPMQTNGKIPIEANQKGEFLLYQDNRVFNSLNTAKDGRLYFWREAKNVGERPLILDIGEVKDGFYIPKGYIDVGSSIRLKR